MFGFISKNKKSKHPKKNDSFFEMETTKQVSNKNLYSIASVYKDSKALHHQEKIKKIRQDKPISPTCIQVDLEAFCNDNCSFCTTRKENGYNNEMLKLLQINGKKERENLDEHRPIGIRSKISQLDSTMAYSLPEMMVKAHIPTIELTGGGEPTLWPAFDTLIQNLAKKNIEIGIITNGSNISKFRAKLVARNCTWIRFSMDASNQDLHKKIHRTPNYDFDKRINSIKNIIKSRNKRIVTGISFVITPLNVLDIEESCKFYKRIGVDYIRFTWIYDKTGNGGFSNDEINYMKKLLSKCKGKYDGESFEVIYDNYRVEMYSRPNNDFVKCHMQKFVWSIGANGMVYPCCIQKCNSSFEMGNIQEKTLQQIVEDQFTIQKMNDLDPLNCNPCWLREKNKMIDRVVSADNNTDTSLVSNYDIRKPLHVNFV
ncbi:MAG: radical SAM protein [Nitrosopumilus sp.]|nr:radical SAM protein [Nitrosopumilus sp.]